MKSFKEFLLEKINIEDELSKLNLNNENDIWKGIELICKNSKYTGYESYEPTCFNKSFKIGEWVELFTQEIISYKNNNKYYDYLANLSAILFKQNKRLLEQYLNQVLSVSGIDDLTSIASVYELDYERDELIDIEKKIEKTLIKSFTSAKRERDVDIENIISNIMKYNERLYNAIQEEYCIPDFYESFWAGFIGEYYRNMNDFCKAMKKAVDKSIYKKDILNNMKRFIESGDYKKYLK